MLPYYDDLVNHKLPPKVNRAMEFAIGLIISAKKPVAKVIHPDAVQTVELPLLGEGSFGQVRLGSYDGSEVAVKTLSGDARCVSAVLVVRIYFKTIDFRDICNHIYAFLPSRRTSHARQPCFATCVILTY